MQSGDLLICFLTTKCNLVIFRVFNQIMVPFSTIFPAIILTVLDLWGVMGSSPIYHLDIFNNLSHMVQSPCHVIHGVRHTVQIPIVLLPNLGMLNQRLAEMVQTSQMVLILQKRIALSQTKTRPYSLTQRLDSLLLRQICQSLTIKLSLSNQLTRFV